MRYPRILTCSSARPRYRSCPSAPQHTRSPLRYIRAPGPPNGHATNRDPVNAARRHIPTPQPGAGHIQLTDHPRRHRPQPPIQHKQRRPRHRRPIGTTLDPAVNGALIDAYTVVSVGP